MSSIKLIVGLGNPGSQYTNTRHNAGFWFVDALCKKYGFDLKDNKKFYGEAANVDINNHSIWLLKPMTYMNHSGKALQSITQFYKIKPEEILVAYDELDLPPGTVKLKKGGGHGGHNGLRDIISLIGSNEFYRIRLGIGHPGHKSKVVSWVLNRASSDDEISINNAIDKSLAVLEDLLDGQLEKATRELHTR
ncbi:MAG: aminoacyl-tRNA hydrolase [Gammaproteobacteria bacterium]|jgi:PTH1 family peptidyl-tRNA hydrolase|nr:aminoacyl-tRNA hydrolase [Xanthomonadales bacterium]